MRGTIMFVGCLAAALSILMSIGYLLVGSAVIVGGEDGMPYFGGAIFSGAATALSLFVYKAAEDFL